MRIFILEDDLERVGTFMGKLLVKPGREIVCVDTAEAAIKELGSQEFDVIFLDHDLGGKQMVSCDDKNTGSEVARWMRDNYTNRCPVIIHSLNDGGAKNIESLLTGIGMQCHRIPYTKLVHDLDEPNFLS